MSEKDHDPELKVKDKRRFDAEGNIKSDSEEEDIDFSSVRGEPQGAPKEGESGSDINFATFIFSLGSAALVELGAAPNPSSGKHQKNLLAAKQNIDLLALIREKTKGNLTRDEEKLLDNFLYDLRMRYVDSSKGEKK